MCELNLYFNIIVSIYKINVLNYKLKHPCKHKRFFNVYTTSITLRVRSMNIKMTLCTYRDMGRGFCIVLTNLRKDKAKMMTSMLFSNDKIKWLNFLMFRLSMDRSWFKGTIEMFLKYLLFHSIKNNYSFKLENNLDPWSSCCIRGIWFPRPEFDSHRVLDHVWWT